MDGSEILSFDYSKHLIDSLMFDKNTYGKQWHSYFNIRFACYFCNEQFRKDYKLKLHLLMKHKNVPAHEMDKAKEVLIKVSAARERK